jgi:hypothetical protein
VATNGKTANDDREPLADGPLQGLSVVEFGQLIAGPYVGTLLADVLGDLREEVEELELLPSVGVM